MGGKVDRLEISWIKAHVGHQGNERADQLAREAVELTPTVHGIMLPYSHFKTQVCSVTYKLWADEWSRQQTCRLSKKIFRFRANVKAKR